MRAPSYSEKRDQAFDQHERVERTKNDAPKGGNEYIRRRLKDLKTIKKGIREGR